MVVRKMKEKCKDAARLRREKERIEFVELSKLLPLPATTTSQLDKASVIRLTSSYLRLRAAFPKGLGVEWGHKITLPHKPQQAKQADSNQNEGQNSKAAPQVVHWRQQDQQQQQQMNQVRELGSLLLQTLDGFVFALHNDGKIMYISETASVHLGLPQIDLTGSSLFEYIHPSDNNDICAILSPTEREFDKLAGLVTDEHEFARSFCMRMRCILPKRNAGLVNSGYKTIHCNGYLKVKRKCITEDGESTQNSQQSQQSQQSQHSQQSQSSCIFIWESYALVAVGHSLLPTASTEVKLSNNSFMFRSSLDLKIYYVETAVVKFLDFKQMDLLGQSLYQLIHVADTKAVEKSHRLLLEKGQVVTRYYRLMKRDGGFIWVQTYATIVNSLRTLPKPHHIVGICFVLAEDPHNQSALLHYQVDEEKEKEQQILEGQSSKINSSSTSEPIKSVSSGYESASSVGGQDRNKQQQKQKQSRKDKQSAQRKVRKLRTSLGPAKATASGSSRPIKILGDKPAAICSHQQNQSSTGRINVMNKPSSHHPTTMEPHRRVSDDTCSVVSSVASTSLSSNASTSHHASDFMAYSNMEPPVDYHINYVNHFYLFDHSSPKRMGHITDMGLDSAYNYCNSTMEGRLMPHMDELTEYRDHQIWPNLPTNNHFHTTNNLGGGGSQMDEMIDFSQQQHNNNNCNIAPPQSSLGYLQLSPDWFAYDNHHANQTQTFNNQRNDPESFIFHQSTGGESISYCDTSQYHESPPSSHLLNSIDMSSNHYLQVPLNNKHIMSSSSSSSN